MSKKARKEIWLAMRQEREAQQQAEAEIVPQQRSQPQPPEFPRTSMESQGWLRLGRVKRGWRRTGFDGVETIFYENYKAEGSLAEYWGFDLARKGLSRSFATQVAADFAGLFAEAFLRGFDQFFKPARIERFRLDAEVEAR